MVMPQDWLQQVPDASFLDKIPDATPVPKGSEGYWEDKGIGGKIWHAANKVDKPIGVTGREDNAIFNIDENKISNYISDKASKLPRPLQWPAAALGSAVAGIPARAANYLFSAPEGPALGMAGMAKNAIPKQLPPIEDIKPSVPEPKPIPKGLPPAARFVSGQEGLADRATTYPRDLGPDVNTLSGTVLPQEFGTVRDITADEAANLGTGGPGKTAKFNRSSLDNVDESIRNTMKGNTIDLVNGKDYHIGDVNAPPQLPTAVKGARPTGPNQFVSPLAGQLPDIEIPPTGLGPDKVPVDKEGLYNNQFKNNNIGPVKSAQELAFEAIKNKNNMGQALPSAEFLTLGEDGKPLFNVKGGPSNGSTLPAEGLKKLGIEIPEVPANATRMRGEELRNSLLKNRQPPKPEPIQPVAVPNTMDTAGAGSDGTIPLSNTNGKATSNNVAGNSQSVKDAVSSWANRQQGATYKGNLAKQTFSDLTDPSLVDAYESGSREGRLADVQKFLDEKLKQGREAGIFGEEQERPNYLRHEYNQDPDAVTEAVKSFIAKNPSIAKTGKFPTYSAAEASGLTRKYNTIPEILDSYTSRFHRAMANKDFYNYLTENGHMDAGDVIKSPDNWTFKGNNAKQLKTLVGNYLGQSPEGLNKVANAVSASKNFALGSGVPKTPLNMHMYNVTRSDVMARGVKSGLGDFFQGVFNPKRDVATIKQNSELIGDLIDHGMGWSNIEDHAALGSGGKNIGSLPGKFGSLQTKVFEDPLFKVHLPAIKIRMAAERVEQLTPKIGREAALKQAATEANDFYGGINKNLRNKTYSDLSRIGLLAPDWLESRMNIAVKGAKSLVGKADPLYAKANARALGMRVAGSGITGLATGSLLNDSNRGSNSTSIPAGKTASGRNREIPIYGSSAEGLRLPENFIEDIKNGKSNEINQAITSRLSIPARKAINLGFNRDDFGKPLYGTDDYGRPIPMGKAAKNIASEASQVVLPPYVSALIDYLNGKGGEESLSKGLELPLNYNSEERNSFKYPKGAPRFRINR